MSINLLSIEHNTCIILSRINVAQSYKYNGKLPSLLMLVLRTNTKL